MSNPYVGALLRLLFSRLGGTIPGGASFIVQHQTCRACEMNHFLVGKTDIVFLANVEILAADGLDIAHFGLPVECRPDFLWRVAGGSRGDELRQWSPAVEVRERDGKLEVVADLPGIKESDVKVEVTDEGLVIQGERKSEHEENRGGLYRSERSYGQFYRLIPLPETANIDQARAEFRNGEMRVTIPVPEQQRRGRQIPISSTGGDKKEVGSQAGSGSDQARKAG